MNRQKIGKKVSIVTIILNLLLGIVKMTIGVIGRSSVLIADGIHSFSDLISTIGVLIGFRLSAKEADHCHPYGHEKIESVVAIILSMILMITSIYISLNAISQILLKNFQSPSNYTIYFAAVSIMVKEAMFWYTKYYGNKIESPMLIADAWHHRSDALSSIAALLGLITAIYFHIYFIESVATIIIGIVIIKVGIDIFKQSVNEVIDTSADDPVINRINSKIKEINGVQQVNDLKTRQHVNKIYVEIEIAVDANLNIGEAYKIAEEVHLGVESLNNKIKHCTVTLNPYL